MMLKNQILILLKNILIISDTSADIIMVKIQEEYINHHLIENKYAF
jgi:hypothetical protein